MTAKKKKVAKKPISTSPLATWRNLNDALRAADEAVCDRLLALEKAGPNRPRFLWRIGCRLRRAEAIRLREERTQPAA